MPEQSAIDNQALLRRTLVTVGTMVGACIVVVGTLTLVATAVVGHVVGPKDDASDAGGAQIAPSIAAHPAPLRPKPSAVDTTATRKK